MATVKKVFRYRQTPTMTTRIKVILNPSATVTVLSDNVQSGDLPRYKNNSISTLQRYAQPNTPRTVTTTLARVRNLGPGVVHGGGGSFATDHGFRSRRGSPALLVRGLLPSPGMVINHPTEQPVNPEARDQDHDRSHAIEHQSF